MNRALEIFLETPLGYAANQVAALPTVLGFRKLVSENLQMSPNDSILDIGCGIGGFRRLFPERYTGVDINPAYIAYAKKRRTGRFEVMSAAKLAYPDKSFDRVVCMAIFHHLSDDLIGQAVHEGMRVARDSTFHIFDSVMPTRPGSWFKKTWFSLDRGRHQRTFRQMTDMLEQFGNVTLAAQNVGVLHDLAYFKVQPRNKQ